MSERQREALKQHGGDQGELVALLSGATAVQGPGVKLVVDDAKDSRSGRRRARARAVGFSDTGRVRDRDMQRVVNGLWESGAEAIAINGQRLTALSAIRAAGDAILVDNRPLVPPYTVLAVGDGKRLEHRVPGQRRRPVSARAAGELRHPHQHLRAGRGAAARPRRA